MMQCGSQTAYLQSLNTSVANNLKHQTHGILAFLTMANDIKVAQFLSSDHAPHFPNLGAFQPENNENHPIRWKNNKIVNFRDKCIIDIDCSPGCLNP